MVSHTAFAEPYVVVRGHTLIDGQIEGVYLLPPPQGGVVSGPALLNAATRAEISGDDLFAYDIATGVIFDAQTLSFDFSNFARNPCFAEIFLPSTMFFVPFDEVSQGQSLEEVLEIGGALAYFSEVPVAPCVSASASAEPPKSPKPPKTPQTILADLNDGEHTENGSFINNTAPTLRIGVGSEPFGNGRNAVINFQLPDLGAVANPFTSASLTVNLESLTDIDGFAFNVDLYAFPPRPGFDQPVLGTLVYYESGAVDPNTDMTLLQTDFITGGSSAALGLYSTNSAGSANLLAYLNAQYNGGAGVGEFVFFRLNPDAGNGSVVEGYNLTSANGANNRPTITY
jgi:hypothetical protein